MHACGKQHAEIELGSLSHNLNDRDDVATAKSAIFWKDERRPDHRAQRDDTQKAEREDRAKLFKVSLIKGSAVSLETLELPT